MRLRFLLLLAFACSCRWLLADGLRIDRLFGPEIATGDYKHPASITELADGDTTTIAR